MTELDRLLSFAARSRLPDGFGYLGGDGEVVAGRLQETWIVARMTHVFGLAALLGRPGAAELAGHGVQALTGGPLRDAEHGGWFAGAGGEATAKTAYVHAFVVLAGATATTAGLPGGRDLLTDALAVWQQRFWDDAAGMAVEEWNAAWTVLSPYRGVNANMHGVEATLAAADALRGADDAAADRLLGQAPVRVVAAGRAPAGRAGRSAVLAAGRRAGPVRRRGRAGVGRRRARRLPVHAGLGRPPGGRRAHALGAPRGGRRGGRAGRRHRRAALPRPGRALARARGAGLPRPRHGQLAPRAHPGRPGSGTWDGEPDAYHLAQMLLLDGAPVRGSLAAALAG